MIIPSSDRFDQSIIATLLDADPLVQEYRALFSLLDWSVVAEWEASRSPRGRPGLTFAAYIKALRLAHPPGFHLHQPASALFAPASPAGDRTGLSPDSQSELALRFRS